MSEPFTGNRTIQEFLKWGRDRYFNYIPEEELPTIRTKDDLVKRVVKGERCTEKEAIAKVDRAITEWKR